VQVENGHPVRIMGDPDHPLSNGALCPRGQSALELIDHPGRLRHPLKRSGPRGSGQWARISWDEALDEIIHALDRVRQRLGPQAVVFMRGGSKGTSDDHLSRLANIFGTPNVSTTSSICYSPCALASKHTYGFMAYPDLSHPPRLIMLWGFNPKHSHPPIYREMSAALAAGARLITIDPYATDSRAMLGLRPQPGTDGALALGMAHVILDEGLEDQAFVKQWTTGIERLRAHLAPYTPERVQALTWVPAEDIRKTARLYATVRPGCILWGNALESGPNNYQTCRAICILRALTGNLNVPGSDIMWSDKGELYRRSPQFTRADLLPEEMAAKRLGAMAGLLPDFAYVPHNLVANAILNKDPYPVRAVYLQGGNLLCTSADAPLIKKALGQLDFLAATDHFMTPTTALADIVLPAAFYLEHDSVEQPWHWPAAFVQQRAADPGQCRSEGRICNDLAKHLGNGEHAFGTMDRFLDFYLEPAGITFDEFRVQAVIYGGGRPLAHEQTGFPTPSGKVELFSNQLFEWGFDPLPVYHEPSVPDYEYPLVLTSQKSIGYYHSCGRQVDSLRRAKPEPVVRLHPDTARSLSLTNDDMASISTVSGTIRQRVILEDRLDPRVAMVDHGWWFPEEEETAGFGWKRANVNMLTDAGGPLSRELGSAALRGQPCRVEACCEDRS
jgi:anaerobic selenocysteine-containing dehydrogenase